MGVIKKVFGVAAAGVAAAGALKVAKRYQENKTLEQVANAAGGSPETKKATSEVIGDIAKATTEVLEETGVTIIDKANVVTGKFKDYMQTKKDILAEEELKEELEEVDEEVEEEEALEEAEEEVEEEADEVCDGDCEECDEAETCEESEAAPEVEVEVEEPAEAEEADAAEEPKADEAEETVIEVE